MKKLYIPIISIIFCTQHIQSMKTEVNTPYSNDEGYQIILKDLDDLPKPIPILREPNALSDKLYAKNITDTEIRQLVSQGAKLNYINRQYSNCPIPIHYVFNGTAQGLKNMETIIELGAAIHDLEDEEHTPLTIALLQQDPIFKYKKMDFTDMILLLMPHENPTVTIYEHNYYDDGKLYKRRLDTHEKRIR